MNRENLSFLLTDHGMERIVYSIRVSVRVKLFASSIIVLVDRIVISA